MDTSTAYELLKLRLGMSTDVMSERLLHLLDATIHMLDDEKGIEVNMDNPLMLEFIVSYSAWLYEHKSETAGMPRYLQAELRNLYLHNKKERV